DIQVEPGYIQGGAATRETGLGPHLVIPGRLILPGPRQRTVRGEVRRLTQRGVEGIVDTPQPEAPRGLGVEGERVGRLVAHHEARRYAVRVSLAGGVRGNGEDAVEDQRAILVEVVVPQSRGDVEPVIRGQGRFAEQRGL